VIARRLVAAQDARAVKRRWLYIVLALVGALLFARSVWFGGWWTDGDVSIGPLGSRNCFGGECRSGGLAFLGGSELWARGAVATWVAGLVAMVALMALAGALAAGRVPKLVARMTLVALATALVAGTYFVLARPPLEGIELGQGIFVFVAAIVVGAVPAVRVATA
jgi:hypothetical protein